MISESLIYVVRPNNTALWLPPEVCALIGVAWGQKLTAAQFENDVVQDLIYTRAQKKKGAVAK